MKKLLYLFLFLFPINYYALDFYNNSFKIGEGIYNFEPIIEYSNSNNKVFKSVKIKPTNSTKSKDAATYNFIQEDLKIEVIFTRDEDLWKINVNLTAQNRFDLKRFFLRLNNMNNNNLTMSFKGPEAIQHNDLNYNVSLAPYTNRIVKYQDQSFNSYTVLASNFKDAYGIEFIEENDFYLFSPNFHADRLFILNPTFQPINKNYRSMQENEKLSAIFYICESSIEFPFINLFPSGKKAALSIQNDADCDNIEKVKAIFWGSNKNNSTEDLKKGLFAHNIKVTNSVFGEHVYSQDQLWREILSHGNTIAYHTFSDSADNIDSLYTNLRAIKDIYNIRLWIDHSSAHNPEDLAINGFLADSEQYIYPILKEKCFDYAWIDDYKAMNINVFNAFDDLSMLPHRSYSLANDYPLYIFTRFRTIAWLYNDYSYSFKKLVTKENLDLLLSKRGYANIYTHFYPNANNPFGFLEYRQGNEICVKPEADSVFAMLEDYQDNKALWIAPSEEIFDRMLLIDSIRVEQISMNNKRLEYRLSNNSSKDLKALQLLYKSQSRTINNFPAKSSLIVTFSVNNTNQEHTNNTIIDLNLVNFNIQYDIDKIILKSKENLVPCIRKISLYNIKGQKYNHAVQVNDNKISFNRYNLPNSVLLCKIELKDKQNRVIRVNNLK